MCRETGHWHAGNTAKEGELTLCDIRADVVYVVELLSYFNVADSFLPCFITTYAQDATDRFVMEHLEAMRVAFGICPALRAPQEHA